jgi:uncharacterized protein YecE (DUF72 family)
MSTKSDLRIGTSGWSYDDWVGPFYPEPLRTKKKDWLEFYGKHFDTVEINSTFYRMPNEWMVKRWVDVGCQLDSFEFSLKLPQAVTHETLVEDRVQDAKKIAEDFEYQVVAPLFDGGLLGCILIQLSPYFQKHDKKTGGDNLVRLEGLFETLSTKEYDYVVELRHSSWLNADRSDLEPEALKLLSEHRVGICKTDGPGFPLTKSETAPHGYIRFHGRNKDIWFKSKKFEAEKKASGGKSDERFNRYDYLYSKDELNYWVPMVKEALERDGSKERLYFNNHPHGSAVQNAFMMMDLVGLPRKIGDFKMQKQYKIDSF